MSSKLPEILRSAQKDESVLNQITNDFSTNFMLKILGPRQWLLHKKWIESVCHFLYFSVTTLSDFQTLGEEYTGILQVQYENNKPTLPSKLRRLTMVLFQTFGPVLLKSQVSKLKTDKKYIIEEVLDLIHKFNLVWFYMEGLYYHFAKRFLSIQYAKLRPLAYQDPNLKWIRIMSLVNGLVLFYQFVLKLRRRSKEGQESEQNQRTVGE